MKITGKKRKLLLVLSLVLGFSMSFESIVYADTDMGGAVTEEAQAIEQPQEPAEEPQNDEQNQTEPTEPQVVQETAEPELQAQAEEVPELVSLKQYPGCQGNN